MCSPASDDRDPAAYTFTDDFLAEAVQDFESRDEMWAVLGADNSPVVHAVVATAARLDRRFCAQLQNLALLSRARRLMELGDAAAGGGAGGSSDRSNEQASSGQVAVSGADSQLAQLLQEEPALAISRDMIGRSLWHNLVQGQHLGLLRQLLPIAAAAGFTGGSGGPAAAANGSMGPQPPEQQASEQAKGGQAAAVGQLDAGSGHQPLQQQLAATTQQPSHDQPHCLNLPDAGGNTPLHLAAASSQVAVAHLLLDHGASLDMQNRCGRAAPLQRGQACAALVCP
jgi:hypothetical protein